MLGLGNILTKGGAILGFPNDFSFNFDNSNDYLDTGNSFSSIIKESFTMSAWIKPDDGQPSARSGILGTIENSGFTGYIQFTIEADGKLQFLYGTATAKQFVVTTTNAVFSDGATNYTHVAIVFNKSSATAGSLTIYANGSSVGTSSSPATGWNTDNYVNNHSLFIGATNTAGTANQFYDGLIDEVAVWSVALSSDDVAKIASKPVDFSKASTYATDRTGNLKLWLRAGDKVLPENDASITRQDFYTDFDGSNDCISVSPVPPTTSTGSASFWVKNSADNGEAIFSFGDASTNTFFNIAIGDGATGLVANELVCILRSIDDVHHRAGFSATGSDRNILVDGNWHHVAVTGNGSEYKIYIDGISKSINITSGDGDNGAWSNVSNIDQFFIGKHSANGSDATPFQGQISSLALYQTALDAQTISQMAKSRFTPMRDNRFSVVDFDGSDDYIAVADNDAIDIGTNSCTLSAWVNTSDASHDNTIAIKWDGSSGAGYEFNIVSATGGVQIFARFHDGSNQVNKQSSTVLVANTWHHVCAVFDSSLDKVTLYANGVADGTATSGSALGSLSNTRDLWIGFSNRSPSYAFEGSVSSVSVYNTAKSAEEVYAIYQQGITYDESSLSGLVGYWRMGDDTSKAFPTIADSSSNSNDGTITNGASDDIVQQMVGGWDLGSFESSSEELGGELISSNTTSEWNQYGSPSHDPSNPDAIREVDIANGVALTAGSDTRNANRTVSGLTDGKLYKLNVDAYYSGSSDTVKIEIIPGSGSLYTPALTTTSANYTIYFIKNPNIMYILGHGVDNGNVLYIQNLSIKEVLQSEVSDTYPAIIDVNEPVLGAELVDNNTTSGWSAYGSNTVANVTNGVKITHVDNAGGAQGDFTDAKLLNANQTSGKTYKVKFNAYYSGGTAPNVKIWTGAVNAGIQALTTSEKEYIIYFVNAGTASLFFDSVNGSQEIYILNLSTKEVQGNVGTMTNQVSADLVYSSVLPDQSFLTGLNSAYNFIDLDGSDAFINCGGDIDVVGAFTISAWVNSDVIGASLRSIASQGNSFFGFGDASAGKLLFQGQGSSANNLQSQTALTADTWFHIVLTVSGTNAGDGAIYVNGSRDDDGESTVFLTAGDFVIGKMPTASSRYWNGKITQVAIYNKALTSTEVSGIYNLGRHGNLLDSYSDNLKGYWVMGGLDSKTGLPDTDSTIYDRSGNGNHGTTSGTATGDLKSPPNAEPNGYAKGDTNRSTTTP